MPTHALKPNLVAGWIVYLDSDEHFRAYPVKISWQETETEVAYCRVDQDGWSIDDPYGKPIIRGLGEPLMTETEARAEVKRLEGA